MKKSNLFLKFVFAAVLSLSLLTQSEVYSQGGAKSNNPQTDNAGYLSQSTPGMMEPGKSYDVSISMKNTGTTVWQKDNYKLKLMNPTDAMIKLWGVSAIDLGSTINPGESVTFSLKLTAPSTPGDYNLQWQMANGNAFFGEPTANIPVTVTDAKVPPVKNEVNYNSTFKHHNLPAEVSEGGTYDIVIIMRNTGATDWNPAEEKLKVTATGTNDTKTNWAITEVNLPQSVVAGGEYSFEFKLNAPMESGEYNLQAQMTHNGTPFGEPTPIVPVKVK